MKSQKLKRYGERSAGTAKVVTESRVRYSPECINKKNVKERNMTAQFLDNRSSTIQKARLIGNISFATKTGLPFQLRAWIAAKPLSGAGSSVSGDGSSVSSDSTRAGRNITNNSQNFHSRSHPLSHHHIFISDANGIYNRGFGPVNYLESLVKATPGHLFVEQNDSQYGSKVGDIIPIGGVNPSNHTEEEEDRIVMNEIVNEFNRNSVYKLFTHNCQHFAQSVKDRVLNLV